MSSSLANKTRKSGTVNPMHERHESVYEVHLTELLQEARERLKRLKADPHTLHEQLKEMEDEIQTLENLHENYDHSMDVFRGI